MSGKFSSAVTQQSRSCETSRYRKSRNKNTVRKKKLARHPTCYLPNGRWNREMTDARYAEIRVIQTALAYSSVAV